MEAMDDEKERYREEEELLEHLPSSLVLIDSEERVLFHNEEARTLFQVPGLSDPFRLGDLIACRNRTLTPLGCGFSNFCPGCEFFRLIRSRCPALNEPFRVSGIAQVFRDTPPPMLWFRYTARPIRWKGSRVLAISFEEVTPLKEKERELENQRSHFEHLFQHAPIAIALLDAEDRFLDCNLSFLQLFLFTPEEIKGKPINDLIVPPERKEEASFISREVMSGNRIEKESVRQRKDGTRFPVHIIGSPITIGGKRFVYGIYQDISVRKEMERKILALLKEKDLILREVHHRIKNNMSLVISLLHIQGSNLENAEALQALETAENRIRSMQILYDKLYRSESSLSVSMKEYLETLVQEIVSLFPNGEGIRTHLHLPSLELDPHTLFALGLILNELITNSMKYAFEGRGSGSISIEGEEKEGRIRLHYEDDGVGLPKGFRLDQSERFGLQLVSLLTEQLGGTIRIEAGNGARFVLEFPYSPPTPSS
ncbi:MAG: hypothetical protein Kow009_11170 [Spirochaetales bacterium]